MRTWPTIAKEVFLNISLLYILIESVILKIIQRIIIEGTVRPKPQFTFGKSLYWNMPQDSMPKKYSFIIGLTITLCYEKE